MATRMTELSISETVKNCHQRAINSNFGSPIQLRALLIIGGMIDAIISSNTNNFLKVDSYQTRYIKSIL
jgi:hypothetical protein